VTTRNQRSRWKFTFSSRTKWLFVKVLGAFRHLLIKAWPFVPFLRYCPCPGTLTPLSPPNRLTLLISTSWSLPPPPDPIVFTYAHPEGLLSLIRFLDFLFPFDLLLLLFASVLVIRCTVGQAPRSFRRPLSTFGSVPSPPSEATFDSLTL